jgi:uncharacterized repeat protein (TIGR03943 family)
VTRSTAVARTIVLAAWATVFALLWALDEGPRYLGPRTQWVLPFGALALGLAALAHGVLAATQRRPSSPLTRAEATGSFVLLLPVAAILLVPQPELGAQAAAKKGGSNAVLVAQLPRSGGPIRDTLRAPFIDVAVATASPAEGSALGLVAGARVRIHGLVVHDAAASGTFGLARFFISCCAADALPIVIPVDAGAAARPPEDEWLLVTGTLRPRGRNLVVAAAALERTEAPSSPYVSLSDFGTTPPAPATRASTKPESEAPVPLADRGAAGFTGRAARVYRSYYEHCKVFTYEALAWPKRARDAEEAARLFAGPARQYQRPAYLGCLAGLEAGEARITLKELFSRMAAAGER